MQAVAKANGDKFASTRPKFPELEKDKAINATLFLKEKQLHAGFKVNMGVRSRQIPPQAA
jgi:hypothetical protein